MLNILLLIGCIKADFDSSALRRFTPFKLLHSHHEISTLSKSPSMITASLVNCLTSTDVAAMKESSSLSEAVYTLKDGGSNKPLLMEKSIRYSPVIPGSRDSTERDSNKVEQL